MTRHYLPFCLFVMMTTARLMGDCPSGFVPSGGFLTSTGCTAVVTTPNSTAISTPAGFFFDMQMAANAFGGCLLRNTGSGASAQVQYRAMNDVGAIAYEGIASSTYSSFAPINGGRAFWISYATEAVYGAQSLNAILFTQNGGEIARFTPNGRLLIGTATDSSSNQLVVNGSISATSVINATYADIAEWVSTTEKMPAGTVVVIDGASVNGVVPSRQAYDTAVAGVISAQPGVVLGVEGPSKVKVATTGRVKVRVDASKSPIRIGDLLVTSDELGVAMVSQPVEVGGIKMHRPGTLIGKALEPLPRGEGEILVLLSLQ